MIYPAAMTKKWNAVYRVASYMKEAVDAEKLKQAVADLAARFPTYYVHYTPSFFNFYFSKATNLDIVHPETDYPCRPMTFEKNKPLFRVLYKEKRISVEFFHSITDGTGALTYLKTLVAHYLELQGFKIEKTCGILDINEKPRPSEIEDSFQKLSSRETIGRSESKAYQFLPPVKENYLQTTAGFIPVDRLKSVIKEKYKCTITEYLVAVYMLAFIQQYKKNKKNKAPIKLCVPANLRPMYGSTTLRNFAMFANIGINPSERDYTFEELLKEVRVQMAYFLRKEYVGTVASKNVSDEKMLISKIAPVFLKKPVMKTCFHLFGERNYTSPFSNIGLEKIPASMAEHVEAFQAIIGETVKNRIYCSAVGLGNILTVTFSSVSENTEVQDFFFNYIKNEGVDFRILREG